MAQTSMLVLIQPPRKRSAVFARFCTELLKSARLLTPPSCRLTQRLRLSGDLYAKTTHFILELIQNAADNQYADGVVPFLKIELLRDTGSHGQLRVSCNETGFTEPNVLAICDVGNSTKVNAPAEGFIGERKLHFMFA